MKLIVATDIFGDTTELRDWLRPIVTGLRLGFEIVSPYPADLNQSEIMFEAHSTAESSQHPDEYVYQRFIKQGGLAAYTEKLQQCFDGQQRPFIALGFSAGAAAVWQLAAIPQSFLRQAYCCYGGQIRHHDALQTLVPTTMTWAQETHFDVEVLHRKLQQQTHVSSQLTPYPHGFINPLSAGFHHQAASDYQKLLLQKLTSAADLLSTPSGEQ